MAKIRVEIIGKAKTKAKKCELRGNLVVLEKKSKKHPEYTAEFTEDCVLREVYGRIRKKTKLKLMILDGASKCINFASKRGKLKGDLPYLDRAAIKAHFEREVMHKQGMVHTKLDVPIILYVQDREDENLAFLFYLLYY